MSHTCRRRRHVPQSTPLMDVAAVPPPVNSTRGPMTEPHLCMRGGIAAESVANGPAYAPWINAGIVGQDVHHPLRSRGRRCADDDAVLNREDRLGGECESDGVVDLGVPENEFASKGSTTEQDVGRVDLGCGEADDVLEDGADDVCPGRTPSPLCHQGSRQQAGRTYSCSSLHSRRRSPTDCRPTGFRYSAPHTNVSSAVGPWWLASAPQSTEGRNLYSHYPNRSARIRLE